MITISGGRFANDVTNYLADGLVQDSNGNVENPTSPRQPQLQDHHR